MGRKYTVDGAWRYCEDWGATIKCSDGSMLTAQGVVSKLNELTEELARYKGMLETAQRNRDFMQRQRDAERLQRDAARRELDELKQAYTPVKTEKRERNGASTQDMLAALVPVLTAPAVTIQYVLAGEDGLDRLRSFTGYIEDLVTLSSGTRVLCLFDLNTGKRIVHDINCVEIVSIELGGTAICKRVTEV